MMILNPNLNTLGIIGGFLEVLYCNCMHLWGVAVLELDSYSDHNNKGPDQRTLRKSKVPFLRSLILAILHRRQPTL